MASFSELQFGPHPDVDGGIIAKKEFENGYGVIVERYYITDDRGAILQYTLGSESGLYQIGFTKNGEAFFEDPLPDNIIGAASEEVVTEIMTMVETLKTPIIITDDDEDGEDDEKSDIMDYRHDDSFIRGNSIGPIEL